MIGDIYKSFRALPLWVQVWVTWLVAANFASVFFLDQPRGWTVCILAIGGILPNAVLMILERGFSSAMAFSHILLWVPFLWVVAGLPGSGEPMSQAYERYLLALVATNAFSLAFDIRDAWLWWRGDRAVAGK